MKYTTICLNEISAREYEQWYFEMSPLRQGKCRRIRKEEGRKACIAADHLARSELAKYLDCEPKNVPITQTEDGKPYLPENPLWFSLSHSDNLVAYCQADVPVGIDVERIRQVSPATANRICTENERRYLANAKNGEEWLLRFFILWTRKEAVFKVHGKRPRKDAETETLIPRQGWEITTEILGNYVISLAKNSIK